MRRRHASLVLLIIIACAVSAPAQRGSGTAALVNGFLRGEFGARGLTALTGLGHTVTFPQDDFSISLGGETFDSGSLPAPARTSTRDRVTYAWVAGGYRLEVVYELQAGWSFLSKQISVVSAASAAYRVDDVQVFRSRLGEPVLDVYVPKSARPNLGTGDYGAAIRLADNRGFLAVVQNPFLEFTRDGERFSIRYKPEMEWRADYGPFQSDRGLLAPYRLGPSISCSRHRTLRSRAARRARTTGAGNTPCGSASASRSGRESGIRARAPFRNPFRRCSTTRRAST
jgi:hypothetical protein